MLAHSEGMISSGTLQDEHCATYVRYRRALVCQDVDVVKLVLSTNDCCPQRRVLYACMHPYMSIVSLRSSATFVKVVYHRDAHSR